MSSASDQCDWFHLRLRVRYAETDAQGVVHHANYLVYMEQARTEFTRARGLPYPELEAQGINLLVASRRSLPRSGPVRRSPAGPAAHREHSQPHDHLPISDRARGDGKAARDR